MNRWARWVVAAVVALLFVATPIVVRVLPVGGSPAVPAGLLDRMRAAWSAPYAGYAETTGSLALPAADQLDAVSNLLSNRTQMRVWWRSSDDWRVDVLSVSGEHSTRTTASSVSVWEYEDNRVVRSPPNPAGTVRLPQDYDTLPPALSARMLGDADPSEVVALPGRRVAGRDADGLRLTPADPLSSIGQVDVWADRASGIPLLVEVFARGAAIAAMSATFLDFTDAPALASDTAFTPPPGARVRTFPRTDLVGDAGRLRGVTPPAQLLGFPRTPPIAGTEGIGQYGHGVTQVVVGVLPDNVASSLRDQLALAAGVSTGPQGTVIAIGPVGLLLTTPLGSGRSWLISGTVTTQGLTQAATELATVAS